MYQTILMLPLQSGQLTVNRKCGQIGGPIQSVICIIQTAILSTIAIFEVGQGGSPVSVKQGYWIESVYQNIEWTFIYDSLTVSMQIPVIYVSVQVQVYSMSYMSGDPHMPRFFSYLSLFSFFMLILITGENLLVLFLGWEGVGQASYLQINFWHTRIAANMAAQKAFLLNRVGDLGQAQGVQQTIGQIGDLSMASIFSVASQQNADWILIQVILLIIGAIAKSAQIGLHAWLASAMEGPTPVSAQIHAATMVTAGVYLFMRFSPLLEFCTTGLMIITWLGGLSAQQGASCGLQENDQKRIIAYSTTSQLGYMVVAVGQSQYSQALFHLINHAFFKALLFLSAGAVIHAVSDQQDIRRMGGQVQLQPKTYSFIQLGSLSQMAFPFLTGFYSKDYILGLAQVPRNLTSTIAYLLTFFAAIQTATYSTRQMIQTFISKPHFPKTITLLAQDPPILMFIPLFILSLGAAFFGYLTNELFIGQGSTFYQNSLFTHPNHLALQDGTMSPGTIQKYLPIATLFILFTLIPQFSRISHKTNTFSTNSRRSRYALLVNHDKSFIDLNNHTVATPMPTSQIMNYFNIYNHWFIANALSFGRYIDSDQDRGLIELIGPTGQIRQFHYLSHSLELLATGYLPHYGFMVIAVTVAFSLLFLISNLSIHSVLQLLFMIGVSTIGTSLIK